MIQAPHSSVPAVPVGHVPRPRLTRLLEAVKAPTILITAPAGYGKTTLAAEWLSRRDQVAWYRAVSASADLAVFSTGIAEAVSDFAPNAATRVGQRLQVGDPPEQAFRPLAAVFADDLAAWPDDAWLAIDDYHLVTESPTVERFVASVLELAPIRLLVTSRRRPSWASARMILHGKLVEVGADQLAMRPFEAARALRSQSSEAVRALVEQAQGWPAVIGLAALTTASEIPRSRVSDVLFRYFAEEVLRQEPPEVQEFMLRAAVPSSFTARSAREVLEVSEAGEMIERLTDEGLLHEQGDGALGFHPLLRSFLRARLETREPDLFGAIVTNCVAEAREKEHWDEAFELASSAGRRDLMADVTVDAAPTLFNACRFETLERWLRASEPRGERRADLEVLRGWSLWHAGQFAESEAIARDAIQRLPQHHKLLSPAWRVLGGSLYARCRYADALVAYRFARDSAATAHDRSRALSSAVVAASVIESNELEELADELESIPAHDDDVALIRAHAKVVRRSRSESLAGLWMEIRPLAEASLNVRPFTRLKFLTAATYVAVSRSDYEIASGLGRDARSLGREWRMPDSERPWSLIQLAAAQLGLRDFGAVERTLYEIRETRPERNSLVSAELHVLLAKLRLFRDGAQATLAQHGPGALADAEKSTLAEYWGLLAIAAGAAGDLSRARVLARRAESASRVIEAHFYPRFARLIARAYEEGATDDVTREATLLLLNAASADFTDAFVIAYRAYPPLLGLAAADNQTRSVVVRLLGAGNDGALAREWEYDEVSVLERRAYLTKRELEVLDLLSDGLTNAEIAERLWVTPSTAKVHVHNVLRKLGVRTRTQAAIAAYRSERSPFE